MDKDTNVSRDDQRGAIFSLLKKDPIQTSNLNPNEVSAASLINDAPEQMDWLIEGLFPRTGMGALAGGSDVGKSTLLRQIGLQIATAQNDFLGFPIHPLHKSALIVCTEDDKNAVSFLLKKSIPEHVDGLDRLRFMFDYDDLLHELNSSLTARPADIVIIDCFSDPFGGNLNDTAKIRAFLAPYQQLCVKYSCFILFLHHTAKRTEDFTPSKNNVLGGQGFEAKMRLVMELRADPMNINCRHLCIVKGNYLPVHMKRDSYVLFFNDQTFTFSYTGERTPFEMLVKRKDDPQKDKYLQAKELADKGYTYELIANQLGYSSKGTISKLFNLGKESGW